MSLSLNIYKDDSLTEIKKVAEAEQVKIPYRVAVAIISSLEGVDIKNETDLINFITGSVDKVDKIIKATFGLSEADMECIDVADLVPVAMDLYKWAMDKIKGIKGNNSKNVMTAE